MGLQSRWGADRTLWVSEEHLEGTARAMASIPERPHTRDMKHAVS